tara:strand:- start:1922 stop:2542 length:621 start_codon:yes stop_codon:yes gene_type:complete
MEKQDLFATPMWVEQKPEYVKSLNKASDKYIKEAKKRNKKFIKHYGDFGITHHSTPLLNDNNFLDFRDYIGQKSWEFLDNMGYHMDRYKTVFTEMWVQEFAKKGGGHHSTHLHWNQHVSGFYFLKCGLETSAPIFHEPKIAALATKLHLKPNLEGIWSGHDKIHYRPQPGTLIIFPGYLQHEYSLDYGKAPFRFIHWNIQAIPKNV